MPRPHFVEVPSSDGSRTYQVDLAKPACNCPGFHYRHACRHLEEAREQCRQEVKRQERLAARRARYYARKATRNQLRLELAA